MIDNPVFISIDRYAKLTRNLPDSELEKAWAWGSYKSDGVRFAFFRTYEDLRQLAVEIARARDVAVDSISEAQRILSQYHAAYMDLRAVLLGVDNRYFESPPAEEEWSLRRVLAHIVGAEMGFYVSIKFAMDRYRQGGEPLVEIDDETWLGIIGMEAEELDARMEEPLPGLLALYADLHDRVLAEFAGITSSELEYPSRYWEDEFYTLRFRLHRFDSHLRQHTIQVEKTLQVLGYVPSESLRLLRLVYAALAQVDGVLIGTGEDYDALLGEKAALLDARTLEIGELITR